MNEIDEEKPVKKGRKVEWKPAKALDHLKGPDGHRKRWCNSDEANIEKKLAEGWIPLNKTTAPSASHNRKLANASEDGRPTSTNIAYREMVGMALPEDLAEARDEHFRRKSEAQVRGRIRGDSAKRDLKKYASSINTTVVVD